MTYVAQITGREIRTGDLYRMYPNYRSKIIVLLFRTLFSIFLSKMQNMSQFELSIYTYRKLVFLTHDTIVRSSYNFI